jgi:hypothetical protein
MHGLRLTERSARAPKEAAMFVRSKGSHDSFFALAKVQQILVQAGARSHPFELPQRYYDWSMMLASFPASASRVRRLLPSTKLAPVQIVPGLGLVSLAAFEYRQAATLAPYNEVAIMIPVRCQARVNFPLLPLLFPSWFKDLGFYVVHLPVTTQEACDIGVSLWGFPKFVADIRFREEEGVRRCHLRHDGKHILTFEAKVPRNEAERFKDYLAYPVKDDYLLKTQVQTKARYAERRFPFGASFQLGDHPIAEQIRELRPWQIALGRLYGVQAKSLLNEASERIPV